MEAAEVAALVRKQVEQTPARTNLHVIELGTALVTPWKATCKNGLPSFREGKPFEVWVVLEEQQGAHADGYCIIYDELLGQFGLAVRHRGELSFCGWYGDFLGAFDGM